MFSQFIGWLMGVENLQSIDSMRVSLAAPLAQHGAAWVLFGCAALVLLALVFYSRYQTSTRRKTLGVLAVCRAIVLGVLFLILAEPVLKLDFTSQPRPLLWLLFDGTESMEIQDEMPDADRARLATAVGLNPATPADSSAQKTTDKPADKQSDKKPTDKDVTALNAPGRPTRIDYVKALVSKADNNLIGELEKKFRVEAFILDRPDGVRKLDKVGLDKKIDTHALADALTTKGQLTAIGTAFDEMADRYASSNLSGVVMFSDFGNNTGPAPTGAENSPVKKLHVPVFAVGVGPQVAIDLATELELPRQLKKAERQEIKVILRQSGLDSRRAKVTVTARRKTTGGELEEGPPLEIGQREVLLAGPMVEERFDFVPQQTGTYEFSVDVDHLEGQVVDAGNHAKRDATIIDDFLRLMYVEYEPSWEWRFVKEVFHRDPLVGTKGFRTFLYSSDANVRKSNPLFLPSLTPKRSDFLANDVIFLGDMPAGKLGDRFCELATEFVTQFGGGLVVIAGPRFGPGQLESTKLADILPVVVDSKAKVRDERPFKMQLTIDALNYKFMQLGEPDSSGEASRHAWDNMGPLPWYQPVKWKHPLATVLAEHPTDMTADGKEHQPLIAVREFPSGGKVVYLGFDETWRLRKKYGELYYREFWGQMIQHIGLSNHIGLEKRFVLKTDKLQYKPDDKVRLTIQAYDANFEPLTADKLADKSLIAEITDPAKADGAPGQTESHHVAELTKGVFETEIPVLTPGSYRVRVKDPITGATKEASFRVVNLSPERLTAVRNVALQEQIASESSGRSYDLETVSKLPEEIQLNVHGETDTRVITLWNTWLCFGAVVALLLGEWLVRKLIHLA